MDLINENLKISLSKECELEALNKIFISESEFFLRIQGETGPSPLQCFKGEYLPPEKTKEDFKMLSCFEDDKLIGWVTIVKDYPYEGIYYITHFSLIEQYQHKHLGAKFINLLCDYFLKNEMISARVFVSLKNWPGIHFWHSCGFDRITYTPSDVSCSEENFASIELEKIL